MGSVMGFSGMRDSGQASACSYTSCNDELCECMYDARHKEISQAMSLCKLSMKVVVAYVCM